MRVQHFFLALMLSGCAGNLVVAQTFTWDGGGSSGAWSDDFNWNPNNAPSAGGGNGINLVFGPS